MNPLNEKHLDDDAFAELSMGGTPSEAAKSHLESCARCREELAQFEESVGNFSMASLAWSEEKSETLPAPRPKSNAGQGKTPRLVPALSFAVALVLLIIGLTVPVQKMHFTTRHDGGTANVADEDVAGLNSPEQIAKDNQLMADVNYELTHSQAVLHSQYDRQRAFRAGTEMTETGKRSR